MPGWSHAKAACSNFLSATWTKCSLNLRSCPFATFACWRHHLPQQECMAMPTQLVHLRFSVTDTRGKIDSGLLSQDRQRWPGARQPGQNSASPAYGVSTGFLQPAHSYPGTHASSLTCFLSYSQRNQKTCFWWEAFMLQALISWRTKAFEVSQIDAYCKKQGYFSALTFRFLGRSDYRKPKRRRVREEAKLESGPALCSVMPCTALHTVTLDPVGRETLCYSREALNLLHWTQCVAPVPKTVQRTRWTIHVPVRV